MTRPVLWLALAGSHPWSCQGFSNPWQNLLSSIQGVRLEDNPPRPLPLTGDALLKQLDIQASMEPKLAGASLQQVPNLVSASIPALLRLGSGVFADNYRISVVPRNREQYTYALIGEGRQLQETGVYKPPKDPIIVYEFESCPFCRKVREACSMLSLSVTFRPTPKGGRRFRPEVKAKFGQSATFPFMIDPNSGVEMFESDLIIDYLFRVYGKGQVPWTLQKSPWVPVTAGLGVGLARWGAGGSYRLSRTPEEPVVLWAYEGSPFCKVVRELLCSLEIPHTVVFTPRGSLNRQKLWMKTGRFQVPYFEDPNTGVSLFESEAIMEYIEKLYGTSTSIRYLS